MHDHMACLRARWIGSGGGREMEMLVWRAVPASDLPSRVVAEAVGSLDVKSMRVGEARGGEWCVVGAVGAEAARSPGVSSLTSVCVRCGEVPGAGGSSGQGTRSATGGG